MSLSQTLSLKNNASFWRSLKIGSVITMKDSQSLELSLADGSAEGLKYKVTRRTTVTTDQNIVSWVIYTLESHETVYLVAKIVGDAFDLYCYFLADFEEGNRADMMKDQKWIFQKPPKKFKFNQLRYTTTVDWCDDQNAEVTYTIKKQGELQGKAVEIPGDNSLIATVVEYQTPAECKQPEMMILELGSSESNEGGLIQLLLGYHLKPIEVEVD